MYRAGRLRRVFRARGKLVGTSDFVVTRGYVQIRVVGFPWETASLEAVVRRQDGALLLRRERAEARLWVYRRHAERAHGSVTDTRFERVTFWPRAARGGAGSLSQMARRRCSGVLGRQNCALQARTRSRGGGSRRDLQVEAEC